MDNQELRALIENPLTHSNIHSFSIDQHGRVFIANTGDYLMSPEDIIEIMNYCKKYLEQIDDSTVKKYNEYLYEERIKERAKEVKVHRSKKNSTALAATKVYVMLNKRNGYYKIGRARNVLHRERTLQAEDPDTEILFFIEGTISTETLLHNHFSEQRIRGEWFRLTNEDIEFIKAFKS